MLIMHMCSSFCRTLSRSGKSSRTHLATPAKTVSPTIRKCPDKLQCRRWRFTRGIGGLDRLHIVDKKMNHNTIQDGGASNAQLARPSPPSTTSTRHVNNFSFTILQLIISSQTPRFLLDWLPFLPPSTFPIQLKSRRFTRTSDSLPSPAI